jgi:hypothetical protein
MGYSYTMDGKLCCDGCPAYGKAAGVRKRKCPHGYCPSPAYCTACYNAKEKPNRAKIHAACKVGAEKYAAKLAAEAAMLEAGKFLRVAAMGKGYSQGNGYATVHVIFRGKAGEVAYFMSAETYDAFPLGTAVTPEDYATVGTLTPAPVSFYSKEIA